MVIYSTNVSELSKLSKPVKSEPTPKKRKAEKKETPEPTEEVVLQEKPEPPVKKQKTEAQLQKLADAREVRRLKKLEVDEARAREIVLAEQALVANQKSLDDKKAAQKEKRRVKKLEKEKGEPPKPKKEAGPPAWFLKHEENKAKEAAKSSEEKRPVKEVKAESKQAATKVWQNNMVSRGGGRGADVIYSQMFGR